MRQLHGIGVPANAQRGERASNASVLTRIRTITTPQCACTRMNHPLWRYTAAMRYELVTVEQIPVGSAAVAFMVKHGEIAGLVVERHNDGLLVEREFEGQSSIIDALTYAIGRGFDSHSTLVIPPCDNCWPDAFPDLIDMRETLP